MKNKLVKYLATGMIGLIVTGLNLTTQAASIQGSISFIGGATLNGPLATATNFVSFFGPSGTGSPVVLGGSTNGNYTAVPAGTAATFTPFKFNGTQTLPTLLWSFIVGPTTYSFQITSISIFSQSSSFLDIQGNGIAHIDGFSDTAGTWSITDTGSGPEFTLGASVNVVPEPATVSCFLLGFGVLACARRFRKC